MKCYVRRVGRVVRVLVVRRAAGVGARAHGAPAARAPAARAGRAARRRAAPRAPRTPAQGSLYSLLLLTVNFFD